MTDSLADAEQTVVDVGELKKRLSRAEADIVSAHEVLEQQTVVSERLANQALRHAKEMSDLKARVDAIEELIHGKPAAVRSA